MSKKTKKVSLFILGLLLSLVTIISFAESPAVPNYLITENPNKEVKTVEANKNREHAEMNITVNKLNTSPLVGAKLGDMEYSVELPQEEKLKSNEIYYIAKNIEELPDIYSVNGKKTILNLKRFKNNDSVETADFNYKLGDGIIFVNKSPVDLKSFIIAKLDKTDGDIKKIYEVKDIINRSLPTYSSRVYFDSSNFSIMAQTDVTTFHGWGVVYPNSSNYAQVGLTDSNRKIIRDDRKEGQYLQLRSTGNITALTSADNGGRLSVYVDGRLQKSQNIETDKYNVVGTSFADLGTLRMAIDYENISENNGGMYFGYDTWNGEAVTGKVDIEFTNVPNPRRNTVRIEIPRYNPEVYSKKNISQPANVEINYGKQELKSNFRRDSKGFIYTDFNVGTKDYEIGALKQKNDTRQNLMVKIPKTIKLRVKDSTGKESNLNFITEVLEVEGKHEIGSSSNGEFHYIRPRNSGAGNNSSIIAKIRLKNEFTREQTEKTTSTVEVLGKSNIGLAAVGSVFRGSERMHPIIDKITGGKVGIDNYVENIDLTSTAIDSFVLSTTNYKNKVFNRDILVLKDGSKEYFRKSLAEIINTPGEAEELGIAIQYDSGSNKFKFIRRKFQAYSNKKMKLEVRTEEADQLIFYVDVTLKNAKLETNSVITFDTSKFLFIEGEINFHPYGRIRVYPSSTAATITGHSSKAGILHEGDAIVSDNRKNGQFTTVNGTGITYPINPKFTGKKVNISLNGTLKKSPSFRDDFDTNPLESQRLGSIVGLDVGIDYQAISVGKGGLDIFLNNWDGKEKHFTVKVELPDGAINNYEVTIPPLVTERYYNKNIAQPTNVSVNYSNKTVTGEFKRDNLGNMSTTFKVGTMDYDIFTLRDGGTGPENLSIKIPKKVDLDVTDELGVMKKLPFIVSINTDPLNLKGKYSSDSNNHYIHPPTNGRYAKDSSISAEVTLTAAYRANITTTSIVGNNKNLVYLIAKPVGTNIKTEVKILDNINGKLKITSLNENIDVSSLLIEDQSVLSNIDFKELIQAENRIAMYDDTAKIFNVPLSVLKTTAQKVEVAGIEIKYNSSANKFEFIRTKFKDVNKNLKLQIRTSQDQLIYVVDLNVKNKKLETRSVITYNTSEFLFIQGDLYAPYGRIRVKPSSTLPTIIGYPSSGGILDSTDSIVTDNRKNGQFKTISITGDTYPINTKFTGKKFSIFVNNTFIKDLSFRDDFITNPLQSHEVVDVGGLKIGIDYQEISISGGGLDIFLYEWDGQRKNFKLKIELPDGAINNYDVTIPPLVVERYFDNTLPLANEYFPTKIYKKDINEFLLGTMDTIKLGTKEYDLRILNSEKNYGNPGAKKSKLAIKIPRTIPLVATDKDGASATYTFNTAVVGIVNGDYDTTSSEYHIINPATGGSHNHSSKLNFDLELKSTLKATGPLSNIVTLKGKNLNLVSIGVDETKISQRTRIIDELQYTITYKNGAEDINVTKLDRHESKEGQTIFDAPIDEHIVNILGGNGSILATSTVGKLKSGGVEIPTSGVRMSYDTNKLVFTKFAYKDYDKDNLKIEFRTSNGGLLIRNISLKLKNDFGFVIVPGKGELEFGDMFPGDFKHSDNKIEFENPGLLDISMKLNPNNVEKIFKKNAVIGPNTTIPLSQVKIGSFERRGKREHFIVSGNAQSTAATEVGEYLGRLEVIISVYSE